MNAKDPESDNTAPLHGERKEVKHGFPGKDGGEEPPHFLTFSRVLGILVVLCLLLAAIVWWQILRGF